MPFSNRIRLPIFFSKPQFPTERNVFRKADGTTKVQSVVIRNTYQGQTDQFPEDWHRKLVIALSHDTVNIEGERLLSEVALSGDYQIDWQDFLNYPVAQAGFQVEVTPFDATNSNCQTCEEATQIALVDDSTAEVWEEGTTNVFPDVLTDNDMICCRPYTISLLYYNTNYFSSCTIDANGVLTATVINPAPVVNNVIIAGYRVTCANGQYDDATVYGNITGSDVSFCPPPVDLIYSYLSSTSADISWDVGLPSPSSWNWELFLTSDLGTVIQSGNVVIPNIQITGLTPGVSYTIVVTSDCSGDPSLPVDLEFTITPFVSEQCGSFTITYLPSVDDAPQSASYMDCDGNIQNITFTYAQTIDRCMLIPYGGTTPIYFVASSVDISINYNSLC